MKQNVLGIPIVLSAVTTIAFSVESAQVETIVLDLPADYRPTKIKVFPQQGIYTISGPQSRMVLLDAEGSLQAEIDLMEYVSADGVYALVPGTNLVEFYDPVTLDLRNSVSLSSPVP